MTDFNLIRNANVKLTHVIDAKKRNVAEIVVDGKFSHRFAPTSRISKHLEVMKPKDLEARLNGGTYFFVGDQLVDLRDGAYNGFVHTDESINVFMDVLGFQTRPRGLRGRPAARADVSGEGQIALRKVWSKNEIAVPGYKAGGDFSTELSFVWNPFVKTINSSFDLVRQICSNGMVGLTPFLNTKIPLMNRWEEHLDIANKQIQNKVNSTVIARVQSMSNTRASVADCLLLEQHAFERLIAPSEKSDDERDRLKALISATAPKFHLHNTYRDEVFEDKNLAAQLPGHLTSFDVYNIATELRSHTTQVAKSSDFALDKFANALMFDRDDNFVAAAARYSGPKVASFSSPDRAFFGQMG